MQSVKTLFQQPKAIFLLSFVEMWNRFSHYGMRSLLVLFMLHHLHFQPSFALGVYAVFCALTELGGIFGGYLAEKTLGLRRCILLGGWIVALGHLFLALQWFFSGLTLLIVGSSLFTTNITALLGQFYLPHDTRRQGGFTLFYMGINVGALLATILCGLLAEKLGWEYGFGLAAVGMVLGNVALMQFRYLLSGKGEKPAAPQKKPCFLLFGIGGAALLCLLNQTMALPLLPLLALGMGGLLLRRVQKQNFPLKPLLLSLATLVLFFAAEEQIGSSLLIFTDEKSSHQLFGFPILSSSILSLNPIVIILCGALAHALFLRIRSENFRRALPFLIVASALVTIALLSKHITPFPLSGVMGTVALISFAELLVGPMVYSTCSEVSSAAKDPKIMALVPIGFSLAALLGGGISKFVTAMSYEASFLYLAGFIAFCGIGLALVVLTQIESLLSFPTVLNGFPLKNFVESADPHETINQAGKPCHLAKDRSHEIKVKKSNKSPVQSANYKKNGNNDIECFHKRSPPEACLYTPCLFNTLFFLKIFFVKFLCG